MERPPVQIRGLSKVYRQDDNGVAALSKIDRILVTDDLKIAAFARGIVHLEKGRLVSGA